MTASPVIPRHPLDHDGVMKIMLSARASEAIATSGKHHLAIITPADSTAPLEAQGRMVLHIVATDSKLLDLAFGVIRGTHKATRIRTSPSPSPALTPREIRQA